MNQLPPTEMLRPAAPARTRAVKVVIEYCEPGNHEKVARRLAEAIAGEFGVPAVEIETVPSSGGVFEVRIDGRLVYSKRATLRFPSPEEIYYHIRAVG